jgi:ribose transport system permease protein
MGLLVLIIVFSCLRPAVFPTYRNAISVLNQISLLGIIAGGTTAVLVMGDFDLSIGALATFAGLLVAGLFPIMNPFLAVLLTLVCGVAVGLISGFLVAVVGISSFVGTLAMSTILTGVAYWYTKGATLFEGIPKGFVALARNSVLSIPILVWIMLGILAILHVVLNHTVVGRNMYAVGGNREAARYAGVNIPWQRILGFMIAGFCAALTGVLLVARLSSAQPRAGDGFLMDAFAAIFLGAATAKLGQFHIPGTLMGALIMGVALNGMTIVGVPFYFQYIFQGAILALAVAASGILRKRVL